jgi:hypothetical protein
LLGQLPSLLEGWRRQISGCNGWKGPSVVSFVSSISFLE